MPDNVDFIQEQQAELLERQINAARVKHCGASALVCEECDAPIPAARRAAYPSASVVFPASQSLKQKTNITGERHEYSY
ncbi:TraR family phage/conjugal plasmid C-4 type zinc finger protein [Escherichia coli]|nr:TraR family phage/conjugal plasmid C-4 type zinc finger protein [Escherichia coli]